MHTNASILMQDFLCTSEGTKKYNERFPTLKIIFIHITKIAAQLTYKNVRLNRAAKKYMPQIKPIALCIGASSKWHQNI